MGVEATELERLVLELINESRAEYGLEPLTLELNLNQSAEDHSQWMIDTKTFSHTGVSGTSPRDRMEMAGTELEGTWGTAENVAHHPYYASEDDRPEEQAQAIHDAFMGSPGHRDNILNPDYTHVGIGLEYGPMPYPGAGNVMSVVVTQNFAYSDGDLDSEIRGTSGQNTLTGNSGADVLSALGGDDVLKGNKGNDTLKGNKGEDTLEGGNGGDSLVGQAGSDLLNGGNGDDRLKGGGSADLLNGGNGKDFLKGGTRNDILNGGGDNDRLFGNRHDDTLYGNNGNDLVNGGGNDDRLNGEAGDDTLKGGSGADEFVFTEGRDVILDYDPSKDKIELDAALYGTDATAIVDDLTTLTSDGAIIDFGGGNILEIQGAFSLSQLEADLTF